MHVGRSYPYLFSFWQSSTFFWPGYVPRKLHVQCPVGFGSSWDRLSSGITTDVGVPDAFNIGDPLWTYYGPSGDWKLEVLIHAVVVGPPLWDTIRVTLYEFTPGVTVYQAGDIIGPQFSFSGWTWSSSAFIPPYSNGAVAPIQIRAATWSEV